MLIRPEELPDHSSIRRVIEAAFAARSHTHHAEADIVDRLRRDGDLSLSLVAVSDGMVAGHIVFSPVAINNQSEDWFGLGPLAVLPEMQRQGIGSALVRKGLATLQERGARGCVVLGDPDYYGRFGFISDRALSYNNVPQRFIQRIAFRGLKPSGPLAYARAFDLAGN